MKKILLFLLFLSQTLSANWHDRKCEGWAYFEEHQILEEKEEQEIPEKSPIESLEEFKKEMENMFAKAVLDPTEENIQTYLELQDKWMGRAGEVSRVWAKVILENPKLDNSISGMPTSSYGAKFYHRKKSLLQKNIVKKLSESHSLLCFYEGSSDASKEFAKVIQLFSKRHNWIVQYISVDDVLLEELSGSAPDIGLAQKLGVEHYPAVYVLNPKDGIAKPVGYGLISVDMIEANIALQHQENS